MSYSLAMVSRWVARTAVLCLGLGVVAGFVACAPSSGAGDNQGSAVNLGNGGAAPSTDGNGGKGAGATGATGATTSGSGGDTTPILGPGMMRTDPNSGPDASCAATSAKAEQQVITKEIVKQDPVALFLVQDRSGSMRDTPRNAPASKWDQTVSGVNAFVSDPKSANLDVALGFFPVEGGGCDGTNYSTPKVAMARLPSATQVQNVSSALMTNAPGNGGGGGPGASGTPIEGALRGGENFCMIYQSQNPLEKCVVVLLTDGAPNGCDQNFNTLAGIAADAKMRANVMTFAVGMDGADFNLLDQIATAGGSNCGATPSCNVNGNGTSLVDALNKIRTTVTQTMTVVQSTKLACEYAIPAPTNGDKLDRSKVNVQITHDGMVEKIGQVPDMASCPQFGGKGWYYDNPADPKSVKFCSETCTSLGSPDAGLAPGATPPKVDVLFGCKTVTAIPA